MHRRRVLFAAVAAILAVALAWRLSREPEVAAPTAAAAHATRPGDDAATARESPAAASLPTGRAEAPVAPAEPDVRTLGLQLRVRLRGLHPDAPWTAHVGLDLDGRDEAADRWRDFDATSAVDDQGLATFALPDWLANATGQKGHLTANDPNYQELARSWQGTLDLTRELVVDVQVVGVLLGRVLDATGAPVPAARVVAFALRDADPVDAALASTNTRIDGSWQLLVPPGVSVWLLAAPMQAAEGTRRVSGRDGEVLDNDQLRSDLLPAAVAARARIGAPTTVPDLVLPPAAPVSGRVRWADGPALCDVCVEVVPDDGTLFALGSGAFVQRYGDGRLAPGARARTDAQGAFVLPALPGAAVRVRLVDLGVAGEQGALADPLPAQEAQPPQQLEFLVPRPILLRTRSGSQPIADARIELGNGRTLRSNRRGELALVAPVPCFVRASHERLRSPWRELGPGDAGTTVDLELVTARTSVSLEFDGDFRVRNTVVTWRRDDGVEGREHLLRDDRGGPFELFLEPGRYHLVAGPGGGERNGVFLLPDERDVEVGGDGLVLRLRATFGGTFTVMATDSSGAWVGGTSQLFDSTGADVTDRFRVQDGGRAREGRSGELLADGVNAFQHVLPPGDYELLCDFRDHGAQRQRFTIKPREVTEVRIRVP